MKRSRSRKRTSKSTNFLFKNYDWTLLGLILLLVVLGVIVVFDASVIEAFTQYNDKFYFLKRQIIWAILGVTAMFIFSLLPLEYLKKLARPLFMLSLFLLVIVLIPGIGTKIQGARRWLNIAGLSVQVSEFAKLTTSLYFASWLQRLRDPKAFLAQVAVLFGLLMLEPDLGTAIIICAIAFTIYFLSGAPFKHIALLTLAAFAVGLLFILTSPYRRDRLQTFLNPTTDPLGSSYHVRQIIIGLGSGGWFGTGLGRSRQKFQYLPEATTDSIFAVVAEEIGFVGSSLVIGIYLYIALRAINQIKAIKNSYAQLLAAGVLAWFVVQTTLNLSAMVILVPLTGIPLPLLSYGGSSLITSLAGLGLLLNAIRYREVKT